MVGPGTVLGSSQLLDQAKIGFKQGFDSSKDSVQDRDRLKEGLIYAKVGFRPGTGSSKNSI